MKAPTQAEREAWDLLFGGMCHTEIVVRINKYFLDKKTVNYHGHKRREYLLSLCTGGGLGHVPQEYEVTRNKAMGIGRPNIPW